MKKKFFLMSLLLCLKTLYAEEPAVCGIETEKLAPCDVKGGKFDGQELQTILSEQSLKPQQIYKEIKNGNVHAYMFYTYDCPHCKKAYQFFQETLKLYPELILHKYEVKKNINNVKVFADVAKEYGVQPQGVPTIFIGDKVFVGFSDHITGTCTAIIKEIKKMKGETSDCSNNEIDVPLLGVVDVSSISLPILTIYMGLLDGVNPCAIWVLVFLLGLMLNANDRKKMIYLGTTFVLASGVVYFMFMTAWVNFFLIVGYSSIITIGLGIVAVLMGLINIKEMFFFKKGISLMIPEKVKPKLYKKSRDIIFNKQGVFAIFGTMMLAVFVNFIELGCTVGLPAIYTRVLSLKSLASYETYMYIAWYNIMYIMPLGVIVAIFVLTMGRFKFTENHAKWLKLVSGLLMLIMGILLIAFPQVLVIG